jgi:hypothetical protein
VTDRDLPSGAEFSRRFFTEVVEPLLSQAVPRALLAGITDPEVAWLPPMIGSIEQWVDCVDVVSNPGRRAALRTAYRAWIDAG